MESDKITSVLELNRAVTKEGKIDEENSRLILFIRDTDRRKHLKTSHVFDFIGTGSRP